MVAWTPEEEEQEAEEQEEKNEEALIKAKKEATDEGWRKGQGAIGGLVDEDYSAAMSSEIAEDKDFGNTIATSEWAPGQHTPLCTICDRIYSMCHYCRRVHWATPPQHGVREEDC